ncbi:MAG TPA: L,D-transpeptidase family protein [Chitinophagaceae bacterium]|nr:L,D-transpeptidase family protein [Chitinophagaceae bacterium]
MVKHTHRFILALAGFVIVVIEPLFIQAQGTENRRANYYEAFVEVQQSVDSLVLFKSKRELIAFHQGKKLKKYIVSLGMEPVGKKQFEGDMRTPEGLYYINSRDSNSSYHKNLGISYPNSEDSIFAAREERSAGGDIKIHGFPNHHRKQQEKDWLNSDWTLGCIAVSDFEIEELYRWVITGCPILILP